MRKHSYVWKITCCAAALLALGSFVRPEPAQAQFGGIVGAMIGGGIRFHLGGGGGGGGPSRAVQPARQQRATIRARTNRARAFAEQFAQRPGAGLARRAAQQRADLGLEIGGLQRPARRGGLDPGPRPRSGRPPPRTTTAIGPDGSSASSTASSASRTSASPRRATSPSMRSSSRSTRRSRRPSSTPSRASSARTGRPNGCACGSSTGSPPICRICSTATTAATRRCRISTI